MLGVYSWPSYSYNWTGTVAFKRCPISVINPWGGRRQAGQTKTDATISRWFRWVLLMCLKAVRFERSAAAFPHPFSRLGAVKSVEITGVHTPHPTAFRQ